MNRSSSEQVSTRMRAAPLQRGRTRLLKSAVGAGDEENRISRVVQYGGTIAALVLTTALLMPVRETVGLLNIGMLFLIVVVGATTFAGQGPGILASVLGFALFNYFLVP